MRTVISSVTWPLLCAVALFFLGCEQGSVSSSKSKAQAAKQSTAAVTRLSGKTMGTFWEVSVASILTDDHTKTLEKRVQKRLNQINQEMSTYVSDSDISRFNHHQSIEPQKVSDAFIHNVVAAQKLSDMSGGVYDITIAPIVDLWGFGPRKIDHPPTQDDVNVALRHVGYKKLLIDESARTIAKLDPEVRIDLSSIAKGYAVDALAALLEEQGYKDYLVNIGGELLVSGDKSGEAWRVAVERPEAGERVAQQAIALTHHKRPRTAMATSGNYRNFIDYDGVRAVHTIDPRTGQTTQSRLLSVTVLGDSCMMADGYATTLMALGADQAEHFAAQYRLPVLFIYGTDNGGFKVVESPTWLTWLVDKKN